MSMITHAKGFTLIELIVAIGLFSMAMLMASGAYLMMISTNRQAQGMATGIDNLSFALETMTSNIRSGKSYNCGTGGDCSGGGTSFSFLTDTNIPISYELSGTTIEESINNGAYIPLTDSIVKVTSLTFYVTGTKTAQQGDYQQPHVTIVITGTVTYGANKSQSFSIETGATMRGSDL